MPESAPGKLTRQQIYDRIQKTSKDEYVLEEMIRLGFWPKSDAKPAPPEAVIKRKGELERELKDLLKTQRLVDDPEAALKAMRKERMAASRKRREENKIARIKAAHAKSLAFHKRRSKEILFLGPGVSGGLDHTRSDAERLSRFALPLANHAIDLAGAMGVSLEELRFLSYVRPTSTVNHYRRFTIPKKTGGRRTISAPMPRLKRVQYWILDNILNKVPIPDHAHGFVTGRSIVSNASAHVNAAVVINLDLENFFPTITYPRIRGVFKSLGYSEQVATLLALICSEPEIDAARLDQIDYYVHRGPRFLPQGAPTSPALSNLICCRMDRRLKGSARKLGFIYTRYADDLTFSGNDDSDPLLQKLLWRVRQILKSEGLILNESKTRIMRRGRRQEVTGIVVNRKLSVDRKTVRRFRALIYQIEKDGPDNKSWGDSNDLWAAMTGYANFVKMVDSRKGSQLLHKVKSLKAKYKIVMQYTALRPLGKAGFRQKAAAGQTPRDPWWQITPRPEPKLLLPKPTGPEKPSQTESDQARTVRVDAQTPPPLAEDEGPAPIKQSAGWDTLLWRIFMIAIIVATLRSSPGLAAFLIVLLILLWRR